MLAKKRKLDEIEAGIDANRLTISGNKKERGKSMAIQIVEENQTDGDTANVWTKKNRKEAESDSDETITFNQIDEKLSEYSDE